MKAKFLLLTLPALPAVALGAVDRPRDGIAISSQAASASRSHLFLSPFTLYATNSNLWGAAVTIGDVSGDGRNDVVLATNSAYDDAFSYQVYLYRQDDAGHLLTPQIVPYGQFGVYANVIVGDFDGKYGLDVAVSDYQGVSVLMSRPGPAWLVGSAILSLPQASAVTSLNLDSDAHTDLVAIAFDGSGAIFRNNGVGGFGSAAWVSGASSYGSIAKGDLDSDGIQDIASLGRLAPLPNIHLFHNARDGQLHPMGGLSAQCDGWFARDLAIGDLNHDGINDIVATAGGNSPGSCIEVFYGSGGGQFAAPQVLPSHDIPSAIAVGDMNRDGLDDVVVLHEGWYSGGVYLQGPDGNLGPEQLFRVPFGGLDGKSLALGDINGDDCPDIAIGTNAGLVTLTNDCGGLFFSDFEE